MEAPRQLRRGQPEHPYPRDRWLHLLGLLSQAVEDRQPIDLVRTPLVRADKLAKVVSSDDPLLPVQIETEPLSATLARELPKLLEHTSQLREAMDTLWFEYEKLQAGEVAPRGNWPRYHALAARRKQLMGQTY